MKVVAFVPNLSNYFLARYLSFVKHLDDSTEFTLVELSLQSKTYPWNKKYSRITFKKITLTHEPYEQYSKTKLAKNILNVLERLNPDVLILCGYGLPGMLSASAWGFLRGKPMVLQTDSKEDDSIRRTLIEFLKGFIVRQYKSALVAGKPHKDYLVKLGMSSNAIYTGYDVVDNQVFHPNNISTLKQSISKPYFLAVSRFVHKKNLSRIIDAYKSYFIRNKLENWKLVICGDGELRPQLEHQIGISGLNKQIYLPGYLQEIELLPYFAHANCFIHASTQEQWGLVVNEAMAAGLPVLISDRCGCFKDLVIEGINGFGFNPENTKQLSDLMLRMSSNSVDLNLMGKASLKHIKKYSPDHFANGLKNAVDYAITH